MAPLFTLETGVSEARPPDCRPLSQGERDRERGYGIAELSANFNEAALPLPSYPLTLTLSQGERGSSHATKS